jgi:hypothetical protein
MSRYPTRPTPPAFHKGQILTPTDDALMRRYYGTRKASPVEIDAWYKSQTEPHDCAGEPWIHSGTTGVELTAGMRLEVLTGRCTARSGWHTLKGCVEVLDLATGMVFKAERRHLKVA